MHITEYISQFLIEYYISSHRELYVDQYQYTDSLHLKKKHNLTTLILSLLEKW